MKTRISLAITAMMMVLLLAACASAPEPVEDDSAALQTTGPTYTVVEHKNTMLGGTVPDWTYTAIGALEQESRFEGMYLYRFERTGADLNGVKTLADTFDAGSTIAREINTRVQQKFAAAEVGDNNFVETYFENVVKLLADTRISGFRKYDDFWVLRQDNQTGAREYVYFSLYTITKDEVDRLIQEAITETPVETDEEQTAQERVREIFENGL